MKGKVAIVTGGAAGIGRGIVEVLLREGCKVTIADIDRDQGERTASGLADGSRQVQFVRTDVSAETDIQHAVDRTLERWGAVDILVNNAGTHFYKSVEDTTAEAWDRVMAADLRSHFLAVQKVLPIMKAQETRGAIVHISSIHALQTGPIHAVYAAAKGGVAALSRSIALECAAYGIRVNTVLPGMTRNSRVDRRMSGLTPEQKADREKEMSRNIPLGRIAEAVEIGEAVAFLASGKASFITGASLVGWRGIKPPDVAKLSGRRNLPNL